ncbi:MAG: hypothetical protein II014_01890, partial [Bifidobacteriaceae bacterium]|nr:hypothetical protein [Bifidobacteriaceae bacterium]
IPEPREDDSFVAQDIPLDIVYEDSDLLVINKPQGMVANLSSICWTLWKSPGRKNRLLRKLPS